MKILCINQFFWPDLAPTGQLLSDVVRSLDSSGHKVTVICGDSVYAHKDKRNPIPEGVRVLRISDIAFSRARVARTLSYLYFLMASLWRGILHGKPDIVLTMTTPPLISIVGTILNVLKGSRHFIWEMDLYPDVATDLGVIHQTSLLARAAGQLADSQRNRAAGVIVLGECMRDRLVSRGIKPDKIQIVHNWADGDVFFPRGSKPLATLSCIYPGNFGLGHDIKTLANALPALQADSRIQFSFVGGGARYVELKQLCDKNQYQNVDFKPYCTAMELASSEFPTSNIGLVLQDPRCSGSIVPSKVYSLLAAGLPILFIGPDTATPAHIINQFHCGWQVQPGEHQALVSMLSSLASDPNQLRAAGDNARRAFLENFDKPIATARIAGILCAGTDPNQIAKIPASSADLGKAQPAGEL